MLPIILGRNLVIGRRRVLIGKQPITKEVYVSQNEPVKSADRSDRQFSRQKRKIVTRCVFLKT
jgi:hypothetical protein